MIYRNRIDFLLPRVTGKSTLELGPAELVGTVNSEKRDRWPHGRMAEVAARLVGIEQSAEQAESLRGAGYDIRIGDAQEFDVGERFEVVVAGELIEHLSRPGDFLDRAREHLVTGGRLLLTTPNRFSLLAFYRVARTGRVPRYDKPMAKHVCYFDEDALHSLLERHGFADIRVGYCRWVGAPSRSVLARAAIALAARIRPALLPTLLIDAGVRGDAS